MYKNADYDQKYYFAYITGIRYINDEMTEIQIKTDVFQTWQFDFIYKESFVERKHVTDDVAGKYTIAEPVATGEYVVNDTSYYDNLDDYAYIVQTTEMLGSSGSPPLTDFIYATDFGGIPSAGYAWVALTQSELLYILSNFGNKPETIYNVYVVPKMSIDLTQREPDTTPTPFWFHGQHYPETDFYSVNKPSDVNGYTPRNKKLLTYPYCYLLMSNNAGIQNILQYEKFTEATCDFRIDALPCVNGAVKCTPMYYTQVRGANPEEGILAGKYPTINWSKDNYATWLIANSETNRNQVISGTVATAVGLTSTGLAIAGLLAMAITGVGTVPALIGLGAMGVAGAGSTGAGLMQIQNAISTDNEHRKIPDSASGLAGAVDINICNDEAGFFFYRYSIKQEFAKIIDNFFDMFGYKVNTMEVPNLHTRTNWNYLKMISPNVESTDVPDTDLNEYKQMLTAGITFWHNINTFRDYSQSNPVIV